MKRARDATSLARARAGRSPNESGFALLLVFLLAAGIAISLYMEVPRVAFESQRAREQMSIDRAMQYARAIQLFNRKYGAFPMNLDDLETARNIRFLRHRYSDPLTGKEYRLLHLGPGGVLTDSLIQPANTALTGPPGSTGPLGSPGTGQPGGVQGIGTQSTGIQGIGFGAQPAGIQPAFGQPPANTAISSATGPNGEPLNQGLNMAARRPSDRIIGAGQEQPIAEDPNPQPQYPQQYPIQTGQALFPGQPQGQPVFPGQPAYQGQPVFPGQPNYPGQAFPGQPQNPLQSGQQQPYPVQQPYPAQQPYPVQQPIYPGQQPEQTGQQLPYPGNLQYPGQQAQGSFPPLPGQPAQNPFQPGQNPFTGQPGQPGFPVQPGQAQDPNQAVQQQFPGQAPQYPAQLQQFVGQQPDASGLAPLPGQPSPQYSGQPVQQPFDPGQPQDPGQSGQPVYPGQPGYPGQPVYPGQVAPGQPVYPGQPGYPTPPSGQPVNPSQPYNPFAGNQPGGQPYNPFPQNSGQPQGQPVLPGALPPVAGQPNPQLPGSLPGGTPGQAAGQPNQAAGLIQQILTTPRQPPAGVGGLTGANGGIAGVGGTAEGKGIHIIREHSKYKEWEFLYNLRYDSLGRVVTPQQVQNPLANGGSGR